MLEALTRRRYRHLTPRYVANRLALMGWQLRHPDAPWLTARAVAWLDAWLNPTHHGLEWGCGRSTVWLAQRVGSLISAESNAWWYERVQQRLLEERLSAKVAVRFTDEPDLYVDIVREVDAVDFVLVDGWTELRDRCALAALPLVRLGGIIVVDNANWFLPRPRPSSSPNSRSTKDGYASDYGSNLLP